MSQKPRASRRATVTMSALAIIGLSLIGREIWVGFFLDPESMSGAGGKPVSNGGPPGARLGCLGATPTGWAVAYGGRRPLLCGSVWRAEVEMMLPGDRPRPLGSECGTDLSFESLVFTEIGDAQAQRIDRNQFVRNLGFEDENKVGGVEVALDLAVVGRRVVDHVEVHACLVRRGLHVFERDFLHVNIDFRDCCVGQELLDDIVFLVGVED